MKELTKQQTKVLTCVEVYLNKTGFLQPEPKYAKSWDLNLLTLLKCTSEPWKRRVTFQYKVVLQEEYQL